MVSERNAGEALTHHVALVLDNDHESYLRRLELANVARRRAQEWADEMRREDATFPADVDAAAVSEYADLLKDWCEVLVGLEDDEMSGLARELLSTALAYVDWRTLATDYLDES